MNYFRRYYEAADDTGAAVDDPPIDETTDDQPDDAPAPEPEAPPAPETYTRDEIAALLPHFEQFANHEGTRAFEEYGKSYGNARSLISQGGHREPQDPSVYQSIGLDPSEVAQPPAEEGPGIFGVPWAPPTAWEEILQLAQSEHPQHRQQAADAVVRAPDAPEEYKRAYWDNAYGQGSYDALSQQQQLMEERLAAREAEIEARIMERFAPLQQAHTSTYVDGMLAQARANIPGLIDHEAGIAQLMAEREQRFPGYQKNFDSSDLPAQIAELQELTLIAASRAKPQREAAQAQAQSDADDAKHRARTETSRTSGVPDTEGDEAKQRERDQLRRIGPMIT